jgi:aspartyl-tRNA(Asn)/glutamyl-tRNA(Gln) amidotransferase subunit A
MDHPGLDPSIRENVLAYFDGLRQAGHVVEPVAFPLLQYIVPAYYVLTTAEASSNLSRFDGLRFGHQSPTENISLEDFYTRNRSEGFGYEVKRRIMLGNFVLSSGYYDAYFSKAQQVRQLIKEKTEELLGQFHGILSPVVPTIARELGSASNDPVPEFLADIFTVSANLSGVAAISLPLFSHEFGMGYGLQCQFSGNRHLYLHRISGRLVQLASKQ